MTKCGNCEKEIDQVVADKNTGLCDICKQLFKDAAVAEKSSKRNDIK